MPPRRTSRRAAGPATSVPSSITTGSALDASWNGADAVAVAVRPGSPPQLDAAGPLAAERYGVDLSAVVAAERVRGRAGEVVRVPVQVPEGQPPRLLLTGVGSGSPQDLRRAGAASARAVRGRGLLVTSLGDGLAHDAVRALVEGLLLGGYAPAATGTKDRTDSHPVREIRLTGRVAAGPVERGRVHALATWRARELAVTPSSTKNPLWLAERAAEAAAEAGLVHRVWDEAELAEQGFGGLLAVGGGSATPPRLVRLDYEPGSEAADGARRGRGPGRDRPGRGRAGRPGGGRVVLVGKGITYDTGGLSIKPREAMVPMKTDMAGAGAVLAALLACPLLGVRRPVTGLLALAENAVSGSSYRPSDVVRQYGGRTVEVTNTDAEGRLVLADALAYADAELDPDVVIDIATLTGAATLGLGRRHAALFTADDRLAAGLEAAGAAGGEAVWRLPLVEEYKASLTSSVADLRHIATDTKVGGGAVVAALFLREFAGRRRWAHLDIAGPARAEKDEHEIVRGPTGYGARLLLRWLETL